MKSLVAPALFVSLMACGLANDLPLRPGGPAQLPLATGSCQEMVPGCGRDPLPAFGCYVRCTADSQCKTGESCVERSMDPCAGSSCEACGAQVTVCMPTTTCQQMVPGCGSDPLPSAGCYTRCTADADCSGGQICATRSMDPCAGSNCEACGAQVQVCVTP